MRDLAGAVAVVTGAASGIGRCLALQLARERCALALADTNAGGLERVAEAARLAGVRVSTHVVDVASRPAMEAFRDAVVEKHGHVNLLINNAGVGLIGNVADVSLEDIEWLVGINLWGVIYGVKLFLPLLQKEERAHIVNISSIFGMIAPSGNAPYCASKFAVRGFTEALRHECEMAGGKIKVSTVHPGGIRTAIARHARAAASVTNAQRSLALTRFDQMARTTPEDAAERIIRGIQRDEKRILIGADAHFLDWLHRLLPVRYWSVLTRMGTFRQAGTTS